LTQVNFNTGGNGGGISLRSYAQAKLYSSEVLNNHGNNGGGLYLLYTCTAELFNSKLSQNSASKTGDGLFCADSKVIFHNSTLENNGKSEVQCSSYPYLTYCAISGDSKWTDFCEKPHADESNP
jgi:hypothetical protein